MAAILRVKDENGNIVSIPAIKGDKGEKGDKGDRGLPGSGGVPDGGTTGQVLTKNSNADGDAGWKDAVQADWNENDDSSPAFVKNRTHYTEYENQFQFDYNEDSHSYAITFSVALDTDKTYELVYDYDIENDAGVQATTLIKRKVINPVTYKGSWVGKFTQKTKYGSTFWCFNDIHPADSSLLPCIYSSDMKTFTGLINSCVNNEAWLNEVKIAVPLDLKYIPETIARASDTVMGTGEEQHFGSAVEEQICSNIGALYRDDLNGYLSDKVDKNQGTANSGKFLGIGADGIVVPTEVGGGSSEWKKIKDISVTSDAGVTEISITEDSEGNSLSLNEAFILIKSETKQYAYATIMIPNASGQKKVVGEYRLRNETENAPGVIRIRSFGPYWMATFMNGGYQQNTVDNNWGFYYQKNQIMINDTPKITGIILGFSTLEAEVYGR